MFRCPIVSGTSLPVMSGSRRPGTALPRTKNAREGPDITGSDAGEHQAPVFFWKVRPWSLALLFEASQLAAADLDAMGIAVLADLLFGNAVPFGKGECLGAGNRPFNSFGPEGLFDLVVIHGNSIVFPSS